MSVRAPHGGRDFWLAALVTEGQAFRAAANVEGALDAPIPSCPGWTMSDLVQHLGRIYYWVHGHVARGVTDPPEVLRARDSTLPAYESALDLLDQQQAELLTLFETLDPDLPAWNWAPQERTAAFWYRRMAHETVVHRWDAQMGVGLTEPIEAKLATDGVDEVLDTWLPAGRRTGPTDRSGMVHLRATDVGREWYVRLRGPGVALLDIDTLLDDDEHAERAVAAGLASDLELALWGRVDFDVLDLAGDTSLLESLRVG